MAWTRGTGTLSGAIAQNAAQFTTAMPNGAKVVKITLAAGAGASDIGLTINGAVVLLAHTLAIDDIIQIDYPSQGFLIDAVTLTQTGSAEVVIWFL